MYAKKAKSLAQKTLKALGIENMKDGIATLSYVANLIRFVLEALSMANIIHLHH